MAELLILEFEGVDEDDYLNVNRQLGIDSTSDEGDWPAGMVSHTAGPTKDGWIVVEVWETREDQEDFMKNRLGKALQEGGIDKPPTRMEWSTAKAHRNPRRASAKA